MKSGKLTIVVGLGGNTTISGTESGTGAGNEVAQKLVQKWAADELGDLIRHGCEVVVIYDDGAQLRTMLMLPETYEPGSSGKMPPDISRPGNAEMPGPWTQHALENALTETCAHHGDVDKDLLAAMFAEYIDADVLLLLTNVDGVYINYRTPYQYQLYQVHTAELARYHRIGQFAKGSMMTKVKAAIRFVDGAEGRRAIITRANLAARSVTGKPGTIGGTVIEGTAVSQVVQ